MSKKKSIMIIICILLAVWWIITYPVQQHFAEKGMYRYMQEQGIKKENIKSKRIFKNHLFGGYVLEVRLKDDPKFEYRYEYRPEDEVFNVKQCKFRLTAYDENGDYYELGKKNVPKYLPFDDDLTYYLK